MKPATSAVCAALLTHAAGRSTEAGAYCKCVIGCHRSRAVWRKNRWIRSVASKCDLEPASTRDDHSISFCVSGRRGCAIELLRWTCFVHAGRRSQRLSVSQDLWIAADATRLVAENADYDDLIAFLRRQNVPLQNATIAHFPAGTCQ